MLGCSIGPTAKISLNHRPLSSLQEAPKTTFNPVVELYLNYYKIKQKTS